MKTVVHVTHEALQKVGGIGAVLQGLCTSGVYQGRVERNILVGPIFDGDQGAANLLGRFGEVLYAGALGIDRGEWSQRFRPVQDELGVSIGSILRIQSEQIRQKRFERAEKLANEAPVKMLFPLTLFIFPAVFLILLGPVIARLLEQGI